MSLAWPWALAALLAGPVLLGIAWWSRRRKRRAAVRVTSIALVRTALPGRTSWRRRVPAALLVLGLLVLGVGAARPQASVAVPSSSTTILLALDVSRSMCSTDVEPNRLTAAQAAAADFIKAQPSHARIGLVAFAAAAGLIVPPTDDTDDLLTALKGLTTSRGTAIGQAILTSLDAIAEIDPSVSPTGVDVPAGSGPSDYAASTIVVLTDGANTQGVEPSTAADMAAARGVRVYTIGFGTTEPAPSVCASSQLSDGGPDGGFGGGGRGGGFGGGPGGRSPLVADDDTLKQVAATTGGRFYKAQSADQLQGALSDLPRTITVTHEDKDLAAWFSGLGGLLIAAAVGLSLWWNRVRHVPPAAASAATRRQDG
ncbi:MAG TPA: VWA domain-containing protein [Mycobacteriales bacterium]|nr:VWA domain-containing protein [Mycobacteriales bacterium]